MIRKVDKVWPRAKTVIERKYGHRFALIRRLEFEGQDCVEVSPLDAGFNTDSTCIWPAGWVVFPGQQLELEF